jgi:hypothetical protein
VYNFFHWTRNCPRCFFSSHDQLAGLTPEVVLYVKVYITRKSVHILPRPEIYEFQRISTGLSRFS